MIVNMLILDLALQDICLLGNPRRICGLEKNWDTRGG